MDGDLFVALTGCTAGIIGDDVYAVAKEFAEEGKPVVGVETAGFKGNHYFGHEAVLEGIIEQFIGDVQPQVKKGYVNVFASVPYQDPYWRGDFNEIKRVLERIGLKVNILFGEGSQGISEWRDIPNAQFNLLISPWVGLNTVKLLEDKYKTPYLHYPVFPVGAQETSKFLRSVSEYAGLDKEKTEKVIDEEENKFYSYFTSLADFFGEYKSKLPSELYVVADSLYAIGTANYLINELGFIGKGVYVVDDPSPENEERIKKIYADTTDEYKDILIVEADGGLIEKDIREKIGDSKKALILGSQWEKFIADDTKNLSVYLSAPSNHTVILNRTYAGYTGGLRLLEDAYSSLFSRKDVNPRAQLFLE